MSATVARDLSALATSSSATRWPAATGARSCAGSTLRSRPASWWRCSGTNGSGKTTLLRCDRGHPAAGCRTGRASTAAAVGDWRRDALARRVAVLPQQLELPDRVPRRGAGRDGPRAARAPPASARPPRTRAAVERALADADALDLAEPHADELSGGERQRVLVAMALAQEPDLLLLDEPTLHLDLAHQVALLGAIRRLRDQRGLTVLAVLHDLNLAAAFAPRVAVLDEGRVAADGTAGGGAQPDLVRRVFGVRGRRGPHALTATATSPCADG